MKIAYLAPFYDPADADPLDALARYPLLRELPAQMAARGHDVTTLRLAPRAAGFTQAGARFEHLPPGPLATRAGALLHRWKPRYGPAYYQLAWPLARRLRALRPDLAHLFGLTLDLQFALLARTTTRLRTPLIVHYHGGLPEPRRLRHLQRHNLARVDRALFTAREQAEPWIAAGLLRPEQVAVVVETSSPFRGLPRADARRLTGMRGDPVCLSTGRLHPIKDPLTTLRGFARVAAVRPAARLYCYYLTDELLPELRTLVAATPGLAERVEFRGRAPLAEMEAIYSSAELLLQSSTREWSGLAVLEAMSCGCLPVVTNIPSFAAMTAQGRYGRLFDPGDDAALADAVLGLDAASLAALSSAARHHFQHELSFPAMARQLESIYADVLRQRGQASDLR